MNRGEVEPNQYLALRDAKIKRNNEKLQKLGLVNKNSSTTRPNDDSLKSNDNSGIEEKKEASASKPQRPLRRSSRRRMLSLSSSSSSVDQFQSEITTSQQRGSNKEDERTTGSGNGNTRKRPRSAMGDNGSNVRKVNRTPIRSEAKPGTTRATKIDVSRVLNGDFSYPIFIGHQLASPGKAAVVEHANLICRNDFGISFNKYSGVCEWNNEAIFLWVNINAPNADVKNEFFSDGNNDDEMQMSWFGGSKMKEESPSIQNLIKVGQKAAHINNANDINGTLSKDCGIVLWCRYYDEKKKSFNPYVCLGRLSYHSHDPNVHPIKFVWNLIDYKVIKQSKIAFQTFQIFANA